MPFLKKFERDRFYDVEDALLGRLHFHANRGKISDEDYNAEYDALVAQARQTADAIACTDNQGAGAYILPLRGDIANLIYQDLLLAFDGGKLTVEQQTAARAYEAMIAPLYGQNSQGFVDYGRRQAQARLEEAQKADQADDVYGFSLFGSNELGGNVVGDDATIMWLPVASPRPRSCSRLRYCGQSRVIPARKPICWRRPQDR